MRGADDLVRLLCRGLEAVPSVENDAASDSMWDSSEVRLDTSVVAVIWVVLVKLVLAVVMLRR